MEQIERTRRYLERIRRIYRGVRYSLRTSADSTDDVYSFFIHCHHIRDWIKELNRIGITKKDLDAFIRSHKELRICADLCNGAKHCRLEEGRKWTKRKPHIIQRTFTSGGKRRLAKTTGKFVIMSDGTLHDALELAEQCMKLWDEFVERMNQPTRPLWLSATRGRLSLMTDVGSSEENE
jgi:hypothetical protein